MSSSSSIANYDPALSAATIDPSTVPPSMNAGTDATSAGVPAAMNQISGNAKRQIPPQQLNAQMNKFISHKFTSMPKTFQTYGDCWRFVRNIILPDTKLFPLPKKWGSRSEVARAIARAVATELQRTAWVTFTGVPVTQEGSSIVVPAGVHQVQPLSHAHMSTIAISHSTPLSLNTGKRDSMPPLRAIDQVGAPLKMEVSSFYQHHQDAMKTGNPNVPAVITKSEDVTSGGKYVKKEEEIDSLP